MTKDEYDRLAKIIVDSCLSVHKEMGPGLLESVYEFCLIYELEMRNIKAERQVNLPLKYKNIELTKDFFIDVLVENEIILEIKSSEQHHPVFEAQLISYLKLANKKLGFLINFNVPLMKSGIKRFVNNY